MPQTTVKAEAQRILDRMPADATWDDLMYEIYVRQAIDASLENSEAGRTMDVMDVRADFGLPE